LRAPKSRRCQFRSASFHERSSTTGIHPRSNPVMYDSRFMLHVCQTHELARRVYVPMLRHRHTHLQPPAAPTTNSLENNTRFYRCTFASDQPHMDLTITFPPRCTTHSPSRPNPTQATYTSTPPRDTRILKPSCHRLCNGLCTGSPRSPLPVKSNVFRAGSNNLTTMMDMTFPHRPNENGLPPVSAPGVVTRLRTRLRGLKPTQSSITRSRPLSPEIRRERGALLRIPMPLKRGCCRESWYWPASEGPFTRAPRMSTGLLPGSLKFGGPASGRTVGRWGKAAPSGLMPTIYDCVRSFRPIICL
jgi:hypothetical protein